MERKMADNLSLIMVFKISEPTATPVFERTTIQSLDFSSPLGLRSILAWSAHVEQMPDDLCSMQCSSVAYKKKQGLCMFPKPTYMCILNLCFFVKLFARQKDNQQQVLSNTHFLWTISCQTGRKSLSVLMELPVKFSMLSHCQEHIAVFLCPS